MSFTSPGLPVVDVGTPVVTAMGIRGASVSASTVVCCSSARSPPVLEGSCVASIPGVDTGVPGVAVGSLSSLDSAAVSGASLPPDSASAAAAAAAVSAGVSGAGAAVSPSGATGVATASALASSLSPDADPVSAAVSGAGGSASGLGLTTVFRSSNFSISFSSLLIL